MSASALLWLAVNGLAFAAVGILAARANRRDRHTPDRADPPASQQEGTSR